MLELQLESATLICFFNFSLQVQLLVAQLGETRCNMQLTTTKFPDVVLFLHVELVMCIFHPFLDLEHIVYSEQNNAYDYLIANVLYL
jgi:hypothetical protein